MYESKYNQFPDNFTLERRLAKGEQLMDIFDDVDYNYKCWGTREAPNRPITVRIRDRYNYVVKNSLLFENWFTVCRDFEDFDEFSYAYRDKENGVRTKGVFINKNGKFVIKEEFRNIQYDGRRYAIVEQMDGKKNIVDLEKSIKANEFGLDFDGISFNNINYEFDIFIVEKGFKGRSDKWSPSEISITKQYLQEKLKGIKYNFYKFGVGLLSSGWYDYLEPFEMTASKYKRWDAFCAVVQKSDKYNFINQKGEILSSIWFDIANVFGIYGGNESALAGKLKNENLKHLSDYLVTDDYLGFNPNKYDIFNVDKTGRIAKLNL